ncbi:hypothetical protein BDV12DRAFT_211022 [Aspergillus spectabilis]
MTDPLSAAGLAYPVAKDLIMLARELRQGYHKIRYAKKDLSNVIDRTETVAQIYEFFGDTIADAKKINDLARTFKKHRKLILKVETESDRIIEKLENITMMFWPLLEWYGPIDPIQRWIMQFQWYTEGKRAIVPVFEEMQILERAGSGRDSIQVQIKHLIKSFDIGLKKLQHNQRALEETLRRKTALTSDDMVPNQFAQEVLSILEREMRQLHHNKHPDNPSTPDSGPPSSSSAPGQRVPSTPPSSPPPSSAEQPTSSRSPELSRPASVADDEHQREGNGEEVPEQRVAYVRLPPFGPPEPGPRPRPGRSSPGDLNSPRGPNSHKTEGTLRRHGTGHSRELGGGSSLRTRGRNGSRISVYGNDGEVTHTHLTGSAGLPSG